MSKFKLTRNPDEKNDPHERKAVWAEQEGGPISERDKTSRETDPGTPPDSQRTRETGVIDVDHIGAHLQSVLSAAEKASARIQQEAREEAERVRKQAKREAAERAESARRDADAAQAEAQRLRSDAEKWCEEARTAAESNASDLRAEAEAEAKEMLLAAERQTAFLKKEAERRHHTLEVDIALAEERLRELAAGLHGLAERLDKLLLPSGDEEDGGLAVGSHDSLVDALAPSREEASKNDRSSS
jgi:vacuolar-type H+-ATPase subunit E/Vma4